MSLKHKLTTNRIVAREAPIVKSVITVKTSLTTAVSSGHRPYYKQSKKTFKNIVHMIMSRSRVSATIVCDPYCVALFQWLIFRCIVLKVAQKLNRSI